MFGVTPGHVEVIVHIHSLHQVPVAARFENMYHLTPLDAEGDKVFCHDARQLVVCKSFILHYSTLLAKDVVNRKFWAFINAPAGSIICALVCRVILP